MKQVIVPGGPDRRLVYYLAVEEYLAKTGIEGFFLWTSAPTVIFGRNQDMAAEVNLDYCRRNSIEVYRRKSGGGCVYSDRGNLMLSCVVKNSNVQASFQQYLNRLVRALRSLGLPAVSSQHNDVLVGERKVSGNACFLCGGFSIIHGTLIIDIDFEKLQNSITPPASKLESHGVKSVRQRVASLRELGLATDECGIRAAILSEFCDSTLELDGQAEKEICCIEAGYLDEDFINNGIL
ncbi:MAG: lipoate--protein ligase family protein [Bacteroidales bacterium]|nr:lipoate--protein ligase family protein [Bacteroidales bacterium]